MSLVILTIVTLSVLKSSAIIRVSLEPPPVDKVCGDMVSVSLYASGLPSLFSQFLMYTSSLRVEVNPRISVI